MPKTARGHTYALDSQRSRPGGGLLATRTAGWRGARRGHAAGSSRCPNPALSHRAAIGTSSIRLTVRDARYQLAPRGFHCYRPTSAQPRAPDIELASRRRSSRQASFWRRAWRRGVAGARVRVNVLTGESCPSCSARRERRPVSLDLPGLRFFPCTRRARSTTRTTRSSLGPPVHKGALLRGQYALARPATSSCRSTTDSWADAPPSHADPRGARFAAAVLRHPYDSARPHRRGARVHVRNPEGGRLDAPSTSPRVAWVGYSIEPCSRRSNPS